MLVDPLLHLRGTQLPVGLNDRPWNRLLRALHQNRRIIVLFALFVIPMRQFFECVSYR